MDHPREELRLLAARLAALAGGDGQTAIVPHGSGPEAILVGTEGSLLRLAARLVALAADADGARLLEADVADAFDEYSPVWPVRACVAADARTAERVVDTLAVGLPVEAIFERASGTYPLVDEAVVLRTGTR